VSIARHPLAARWARHHAAWRDPVQVAVQWREATETDPRALRYTVSGEWWETLAVSGATFLVTREYEHVVMALRADEQGPVVTYLPLPHPSGLAVDRARGIVHLASTRNPNQVYDLRPVSGVMGRADVRGPQPKERPLLPTRARYYPGCLYLHDLAMIGGRLHGTAAGQNAVVRLDNEGGHPPVWWPRCVERPGGPAFDRNYIQLNSIAAGPRLFDSFFSASADHVSARRPGHHNFPVNRRGVIFSGATRLPVVRGLTRPHSARLHRGRLWVDNSGYGEVGIGEDGAFVPVARLPGWTRGLCFHDHVAFVGTSRVIPRFRQYAPGLDVASSACGLHAVDSRSGRVLGSLVWPEGNQIFAIDWLPSEVTGGLPFRVGARRARERDRELFYAFETTRAGEGAPGAPGGRPR